MIAVDTSVVVAALLTWHERHDDAARALGRAMAGREGFILPVHVLLECYAVLTRLPPPHRLSPEDALSLLSANFRDVKLASLASRSVWPLLTRLAGKGIAGGATYDALIMDAARGAGATALLTLNSRDFERFDGGIEVLAP